MRPLILITNDDGVMSPGLQAAAEAAAVYGDLVIAAPEAQQTGMGRAFPKREDNGRIIQHKLRINGRRVMGYGVCGSPALAVSHGIMELAPRKPDLCISGINYGENLGMVLTCSGTVGAAFEAASHKIPSIAISRVVNIKEHYSEKFKEMDWTSSKQLLDHWIKSVLLHGMPEHTDILNINIPGEMKEECSFRITTQSRQSYFVFQKPEKRDLEKPFVLPAKLSIDMDSIEEDSDIYAIHVDHVASVTPLNMDMSRGLKEVLKSSVDV